MDTPTPLSEPKRRLRPFQYGQRQRSLTDAINSRAIEAVHARRSRLIPDQNALAYRHGQEWSTSHNPDSEDFSQFQTVSTEATVPFYQIVDHRIYAIAGYISQVADGMEKELFRTVFGLINRTTEKTGNVVRSSGNNASDFLAMLRKIETGCDRYGRATMPTIYTGLGVGQKVFNELDQRPVEFKREVEELKIAKEKSAISQEARRISRFRW